MITNSKQSWNEGDTVRVGFMTLKVVAHKAVKDYMPDLYLLTSLDGLKHYEFIPHNGLARLSREEAANW